MFFDKLKDAHNAICIPRIRKGEDLLAYSGAPYVPKSPDVSTGAYNCLNCGIEMYSVHFGTIYIMKEKSEFMTDKGIQSIIGD